MRFRLLLLLTVLLSGCMSVSERFYLPRDRTIAFEGTTCGSVPYGGWHHPLTQNASISLSASPKETGLAISIQIILNPNVEFQFLESKMLISVDSGPPFSVPITLYGRPQQAPIDATIKIYGTSQRLPQFASAQVAIAAPKAFLIQLPEVSVDGKRINVPSTEVELVQRSGVKSCIQ